MNKIAHGIVLLSFALACWFVWGLLRMSAGVPLGGHALPAYTRLCIGLGPTVLPALVAAGGLYCAWVWARRSDRPVSWVAFLATTSGVLSFMLVLVVIAAYLPLLDALNRLAPK